MSLRTMVSIILAVVLSVSCGGGGGDGGSSGIIADAGADVSALRFDTVRLDGSGSVGAGQYEWQQIDGPYVTIDDPGKPVVAIRVPAVGTYHFRLTVRKGDTVASDEVEVVVRERPTMTIVSPLARSSVTSDSSLTIAGRVSAAVERIRATNKVNGATAESAPDEFGLFELDGPAIEKGDNEISVTAYDSSGPVVTKELLVSRTTDFQFLDPLKLSTSSVAVGKEQDVVATVALDGVDPEDHVELAEIDAEGNVLAVVSNLKDDGNVSAGDKYRDDNEFSGKFTVQFGTVGKHRYRVFARGEKTEFGNIASIAAYMPHDSASYDEALAETDRMVRDSALDLALPGTREPELAKDALVAAFQASPLVTAATMAPDRRSIDVRYASGITTTILVDKIPASPMEQKTLVQARAASTSSSVTAAVPGSFKMVLFAPLYRKICGWDWVGEKTVTTLSRLREAPYYFDPLVRLIPLGRLRDDATAEKLKENLQAGLLVFYAEGTLIQVDGQEVAALVAEDRRNDRNLLYKDDLDARRIRILYRFVRVQNCWTGEWKTVIEQKYLLTPAFFDHYIDRLPNTLVYALPSQTVTESGVLANTFLRKGAAAVLGFTGQASNEYARSVSYLLLDLIAAGMSLEESVRLTKKYAGESDSTDSSSSGESVSSDDGEAPAAELRIIGGGGAKAYRLSKAQVFNGSFEVTAHPLPGKKTPKKHLTAFFGTK